MMDFENRCYHEEVVDEKMHCDAMMFMAQCLWRDYEAMAERPHNKRMANRLLDQIDEIEANLKELGVFTPA